jgi:hypothetical protein
LIAERSRQATLIFEQLAELKNKDLKIENLLDSSFWVRMKFLFTKKIGEGYALERNSD